MGIISIWQIEATSPLTHNISSTAKVTHASLKLCCITKTYRQSYVQTLLALQWSGESKVNLEQDGVWQSLEPISESDVVVLECSCAGRLLCIHHGATCRNAAENRLGQHQTTAQVNKPYSMATTFASLTSSLSIIQQSRDAPRAKPHASIVRSRF